MLAVSIVCTPVNFKFNLKLKILLEDPTNFKFVIFYLFFILYHHRSVKGTYQYNKNTSDKAFFTWAQTNASYRRSDVLRLLRGTYTDSLVGGAIVKERHADGGIHFHAACFGTFKRKGAFELFNSNTATYRNSDNEPISPVGGACKMQFSHGSGKPWPFIGTPKPSMLDYLLEASPKKEIDENPRLFLIQEDNSVATVDLEQLKEAYQAWNPPAQGLMGKIARVREMAEAGADRGDVIEMIASGISRDNAHEFNILMEMYRSTPIYTLERPIPAFEPHPWQKLVIDFCMKDLDEMDNNHRGMWLHSTAGSGKSTIIKILQRELGSDGIFFPTTKNGAYTDESMTGYANQRIIVLDDVRAYEDTNNIVHHKATFIKFIKQIATGDRMSYVMYGKRHDYDPYARILITSNYAMPTVMSAEENKALRRRYIEICSTNEHVIAGILGLPRELTADRGRLRATMAATAAAARAGEIASPATRTRAYTPPDSGNPAPRYRVRFNEEEHMGVAALSDRMSAMTSPSHEAIDVDIDDEEKDSEEA